MSYPGASWFVDINGTQYGPCDEATLRQWIAENRITPQTPACQPGGAQWLPVGRILGLAVTATPAAAAVPSWEERLLAPEEGRRLLMKVMLLCGILFLVLAATAIGASAEDHEHVLFGTNLGDAVALWLVALACAGAICVPIAAIRPLGAKVKAPVAAGLGLLALTATASLFSRGHLAERIGSAPVVLTLLVVALAMMRFASDPRSTWTRVLAGIGVVAGLGVFLAPFADELGVRSDDNLLTAIAGRLDRDMPDPLFACLWLLVLLVILASGVVFPHCRQADGARARRGFAKVIAWFAALVVPATFLALAITISADRGEPRLATLFVALVLFAAFALSLAGLAGTLAHLRRAFERGVESGRSIFAPPLAQRAEELRKLSLIAGIVLVALFFLPMEVGDDVVFVWDTVRGPREGYVAFYVTYVLLIGITGIVLGSIRAVPPLVRGIVAAAVATLPLLVQFAGVERAAVVMGLGDDLVGGLAPWALVVLSFGLFLWSTAPQRATARVLVGVGAGVLALVYLIPRDVGPGDAIVPVFGLLVDFASSRDANAGLINALCFVPFALIFPSLFALSRCPEGEAGVRRRAAMRSVAFAALWFVPAQLLVLQLGAWFDARATAAPLFAAAAMGTCAALAVLGGATILQAIDARRAARAAQPPAQRTVLEGAAPQPYAAQPPFAPEVSGQRLQELQRLYQAGLLTPAEYEAKRQQIIREL